MYKTLNNYLQRTLTLVAIKQRPRNKAFQANVTPIRFLSRMLPQVNIQTSLLRKTLGTKMAHKWLLFRMYHTVGFKQIPGGEILAADVALKRLFPRMDTHMIP